MTRLIYCPTLGRIKSANRDAAVLFGYPHTAFKEAKLAHLVQLAGGSHVCAFNILRRKVLSAQVAFMSSDALFEFSWNAGRFNSLSMRLWLNRLVPMLQMSWLWKESQS